MCIIYSIWWHTGHFFFRTPLSISHKYNYTAIYYHYMVCMPHNLCDTLEHVLQLINFWVKVSYLQTDFLRIAPFTQFRLFLTAGVTGDMECLLLLGTWSELRPCTPCTLFGIVLGVFLNCEIDLCLFIEDYHVLFMGYSDLGLFSLCFGDMTSKLTNVTFEWLEAQIINDGMQKTWR